MPVLDAEPSACDASGAQQLPSCPDSLSPPPDLYVFPPVLSPQICHPSENEEFHPLYSDPPVLSPQLCAGEEPVSPPPSTASLPPLEEVTGSVAGSGEEAESRCGAPFSQDRKKRRCPSSPEHSWSKRRKSAKHSGGRERSAECHRRAMDDSSSSDGDRRSLCRRSRDASSDAPRLVPCAEPQEASPSPDARLSLCHSTSLCIEPALIPDLHRLSSPSSDSDWDSGLLLRLGPASADPPAPADPAVAAAAARELDTELLHRSCTWMQDSGYESRLHTVLQPQAAGAGVGVGVGVGAGSLCGEDVDSSAFSRTLVKIVEVKH